MVNRTELTFLLPHLLYLVLTQETEYPVCNTLYTYDLWTHSTRVRSYTQLVVTNSKLDFSPDLGDGFMCSSMALSNNFFLSLTDIFVNGGVGDEVGDCCISKIRTDIDYQFSQLPRGRENTFCINVYNNFICSRYISYPLLYLYTYLHFAR